MNTSEKSGDLRSHAFELAKTAHELVELLAQLASFVGREDRLRIFVFLVALAGFSQPASAQESIFSDFCVDGSARILAGPNTQINIRPNASTADQPVGSFGTGEEFVVEDVVIGEEVNGNPVWYGGDGGFISAGIATPDEDPEVVQQLTQCVTPETVRAFAVTPTPEAPSQDGTELLFPISEIAGNAVPWQQVLQEGTLFGLSDEAISEKQAEIEAALQIARDRARDALDAAGYAGMEMNSVAIYNGGVQDEFRIAEIHFTRDENGDLIFTWGRDLASPNSYLSQNPNVGTTVSTFTVPSGVNVEAGFVTSDRVALVFSTEDGSEAVLDTSMPIQDGNVGSIVGGSPSIREIISLSNLSTESRVFTAQEINTALANANRLVRHGSNVPITVLEVSPSEVLPGNHIVASGIVLDTPQIRIIPVNGENGVEMIQAYVSPVLFQTSSGRNVVVDLVVGLPSFDSSRNFYADEYSKLNVTYQNVGFEEIQGLFHPDGTYTQHEFILLGASGGALGQLQRYADELLANTTDPEDLALYTDRIQFYLSYAEGAQIFTDQLRNDTFPRQGERRLIGGVVTVGLNIDPNQ